MKRKSLYLILAATAVVVTCEPQRSNNDIIWYPVDDEDGVFISTIGEKYRTSPNPKWRSHRLPRYSGTAPLPLSYDPSENYDPSFFNNIHERRPYIGNSPVPKVPPSFQNQYPNYRPYKRPQPQANQIQEIIVEVYDFTKTPSVNGYPGNQQFNQWNNRPATGNQNQWGANPFLGNNNQWGGGQRPATNQWAQGQRPVSNMWGAGQKPASNQWGGSTGSLVSGYPGQLPPSSIVWGGNSGTTGNGQRPDTSNLWGGTSASTTGGQRPDTSNIWGGTSGSTTGGQRPNTSNQWGGTSGSTVNGQRPDISNQWGSGSGSQSIDRPTNTEWITPDNTNRPNNRPNGINKPTDQSDKLVFPDENSFIITPTTGPITGPSTTTTTTMVPIDLIPTDPPTRSPCEIMCPVTPEFNPVCGTDSVTYSNAGRLKCAQMCGKNVGLSHYGNCGRTPLVTPLVSNNHKHKFSEFW